ncbi:MAG: hypothetical protein LBN09_09305 [Clostridioides sp.]|nr:hypothetical protein [Clostridioides sp.]
MTEYSSEVQHVSIRDLFNDHRCDSFVKFCEDNSLMYIDEINEEILVNYSYVPYVGITKVERVRQILDKLDRHRMGKDYDVRRSLRVDERWYNILAGHKLSVVYDIFEIDYDLEDKCILVEDIQGKSLVELGPAGKFSLLRVVNMINGIRMPENIIRSTRKRAKFKPRDVEIIKLRYNCDLTLKEISDEYGLSRERVRQIAKKLKSRVEKYLYGENFVQALRLIFIGREYCSVEELYEVFSNSDEQILELVLKEDITLFKFEPLDIVFFSSEKLVEIENKMDELVYQLPKIVKVSDGCSSIVSSLTGIGLDDIDTEQVKEGLTHYGYKKYGEYLSLSKLTNIDISRILFSNYIDKPLYYDELSFEMIVDLSKRYLNLDIASSFRGLERSIRDTGNVILVDARTYLDINKLNINMECTRFLESIFRKELEKNEIINSGNIFNKYRSELEGYGIMNKYILYSVSEAYLSDKFSIGKGNTLNISRELKKLELSREERVAELINRNGGRIKRDEVIDALGWSQIKFDDTLVKSDSLIRIGEIVTTFENINLSESVKKRIMDVFEDEIKKGYVTSYNVFSRLVLEEETAKFLRDNAVEDANKFYGLLRSLFPDVYSRGVLFIKDYSKYRNFEEIVLFTFKDKVFTRNDLKTFIIGSGYSPVNYSSLFNKLTRESSIIAVSDHEFRINQF